MQDLIKAAKANPGKLNVGTINPGSTQNLAAELFKNVAGIQIQIVPFRTSADMATALLRGDVDAMFEFYTAAHGLLADKKVVVLASTGPKRSEYLPDVPTAVESRPQGLRGGELERHVGADGDAQIRGRHAGRGHQRCAADSDVQEKSKTLGMDMRASTPAEMDKRMKDDIAKWWAVIEKAGIQKRD